MTTQVEQTLNVTVAQIEDALLRGQTVPDFAREWSEPPANVLAIYRRLQDEGRIPRNGPAQVATTPKTRPLASVAPSAPVTANVSQPRAESLVEAAKRSSSSRTRQLGVRLFELASDLRQRLADEREAAEAKEQQKAERDAAAAEVARLEAQLRAARAKMRPPGKQRIVSEAGRASMQENAAKGRQAAHVDSPCRKGCGFIAKSTAGRAGHERHCAGAS